MQPSSDSPRQHLDDLSFIVDADRRRAVLIATCAALMAVVASASGLSVAQQELALDLNASQSGAREAFVEGWAASIWVGAAVMGALFVFLALRAPRVPPPGAWRYAEVEAPAPTELGGVGATR